MRNKMRRIPILIGAILLLLFAKPGPPGIAIGIILIAVGG